MGSNNVSLFIFDGEKVSFRALNLVHLQALGMLPPAHIHMFYTLCLQFCIPQFWLFSPVTPLSKQFQQLWQLLLHYFPLG